jgi:hypothetical protein
MATTARLDGEVVVARWNFSSREQRWWRRLGEGRRMVRVGEGSCSI